MIVPIANEPNQDDVPLSIIRNAFSSRQVIGVSGDILARGGGGVIALPNKFR